MLGKKIRKNRGEKTWSKARGIHTPGGEGMLDIGAT